MAVESSEPVTMYLASALMATLATSRLCQSKLQFLSRSRFPKDRRRVWRTGDEVFPSSLNATISGRCPWPENVCNFLPVAVSQTAGSELPSAAAKYLPSPLKATC